VTDADGNGSCTLTPAAAGSVELSAAFAGTDDLSAASASRSVEVVAAAQPEPPRADGPAPTVPALPDTGTDLAPALAVLLGLLLTGLVLRVAAVDRRSR
jgi:hypothetical protein